VKWSSTERPEEPEDARTLYEKLKANEDKKAEEAEEQRAWSEE
jgi:hypothetical protein